MRLSHSKKAVEGYIVTIILVILTLVIGAIVINLVRNYVGDKETDIVKTASQTKCGSDVIIKIPVVNKQEDLCQGGGWVNFTLENVGLSAIEGLTATVIGESSIVTNTSSTQLPKGSIAKYNLVVATGAIGNLRQIRIIPRVNVTGESNAVVCSDVKIVRDASGIRSCGLA